MNYSFYDKVKAFTEKKSLFSAPCHVLVGVSGGADSMALLHVMTHWSEPALQVSVVHIHHGLRGVFADNDAAFVRDYCGNNNIPLTVIHADVAAVAKEQHLTIEEAGRRVRYEQFETVRRSIGADFVLTAHHADDQVETVLMHLIRGCGTDGLTGIPAKRGNICRPLLCCTRAEIAAYCQSKHIPYVSDETNSDTRYTRNDVRHRVLPLLREMNPAVDEAVLRLSRHAAEDAECLNRLAETALGEAQLEEGYSAVKMSEQSVAVRHRMIRLLLRGVGLSSVEEAYVLAADEAVLRRNGSVSLCDGYVFSVEQGNVAICKESDVAVMDPIIIESLPCTVRFGDYNCTLSVCAADDEIVHKLLLQSIVDYDKIVGKLCLRCRRVGDNIHPAGRGVGKSLKKLMNEMHIPAHLRDTYPLLCDEKGIVLLSNHTCDQRVSVTDATKHYLVCELSRVQG